VEHLRLLVGKDSVADALLRHFEQMNLYEAIKKRIETIVSLPAFTDELFPQDIASMLKSRLTFKEAIESPDQSLMSRHRLKVAYDRRASGQSRLSHVRQPHDHHPYGSA
jgi:hypothetical protein